ncbi:sarcosine oxidase subunit gamma family protein [Aquibium sp. ELW1220]|uniref:sarcosine oxidase subunit gamma family protein n=1 Tax=Aquibium sp. ELW1220 TaxID=2976766 RepID=UPI0025AEFB2D|nr:sarcosine oxidase subunit gamma family protein [Aquibium sp. ELW1220]MDN2580406.1 sarcosine oxidase subunit gamma family protein [Aquibium sp. ELW1220]
MVEQVSPLGSAWTPGRHGNLAGEAGVVLSETRPGSIVQAAAFPGSEKAVMAAIAAATGLALPDGAGGGVATDTKAVFGIAPGRFLVIDQVEGLADRLKPGIPVETGAVTDLSHGRTAIRIAGPQAEWVLSKLFAIDFALAAFPLGAGRATQHHDVLAAIQRTGPDRFDLYVFRSLARSFWTMLVHAGEEVGCEVR